MNRYILVILFNCFCILSIAQKPPIDSAILSRWQEVKEAAITKDGKFVSYIIQNSPVGSRTLVVKSSEGEWEKRIVGARGMYFSGDNRSALFFKEHTLYFLTLGTSAIDSISNVAAFKMGAGGNREWVAYKTNDSSSALVVRNVVTGGQRTFAGIQDYVFSPNDSALVLIESQKREGLITLTMEWLDLNSLVTTGIWTGKGSSQGPLAINSIRFDLSGDQVTFLVREDIGSAVENSLFCYREGTPEANCLANDRSASIEPDLRISDGGRFSHNGRWLFFQLQPREKAAVKPKGIMVDVWSYKDKQTQPEQVVMAKDRPAVFAAVVNVAGGKTIRLEDENEELKISPDQITGDDVVVGGKYVEPWWKFAPQPSFYLRSLKDGSRKLIKRESNSLTNFTFSPTGRYLVFFDKDSGAYFSFDTEQAKIRNITRSINRPVYTEYQRGIDHAPIGFIPAWEAQGRYLLVYDNYDIWRVSPDGAEKPMDVTNNYGTIHHIKLRLVYTGLTPNKYPLVISGDSSILVTGFNVENKYNGFYTITANKAADPRLLVMGPYTYYHDDSQLPYFDFATSMAPVKARDRRCWLVKRESAREAPNLYFTRDFKTFIPESRIEPESACNWLSTELVTWRQFDGTISQGVLFKPENFDPNKLYPVIFHYYEKFSYRLFEFPVPGYTEGDINVPWFVSRGYLLFLPDIYYKPANTSGKPVGAWAYNSVVSAAEYLTRLPYVDGKKMAIQGHSFGGGETNYLVAHSNLFAAACEAAGTSDEISGYLTLVPLIDPIEHYNPQTVIERGHGMWGATPWERPDLYLQESAVLAANRVQTPLLIMHNMRDNQIQWHQGVELYMALRRLGKPVWMLQYDNGAHGLLEKEAADFTKRLEQFFGYYLKNEPPPKWMTEGIPARLKGIDTGFELDSSGKKP